VTEKQGNIYYDNQQLTSSGKDSMAVLSPDDKQVVFVRDDALWLMDVTSNNAHAIVVSAENENVKQHLTELNNPRFSLDGKAVYFLSAAWVTSNAVHVVDLATHKQHFVTDANSLELVPRGKYKGYLIVSKHKYHKGGGSYEDFWLVSPKGKAIKSLGEEEERVNAFLKAN
jgi:Tol biopolymer transport system component